VGQDGWANSEGFAISKDNKDGVDRVTTILIVVHNPEAASDVASFLSRNGWRSVVCPSVSSPEFLKEFSQAGLLVTDLVPPVLRLLQVNASSLLSGVLPLLILAAPGHCAGFAAMLPSGRGACLPFQHDAQFLRRVEMAARELIDRQAAEPPAVEPAGLPSKRVVADPAHSRRPNRLGKAMPRPDRLISDIAHDLRTPLAAIGEFAALMESGMAGATTEQQQRYLGAIERRCQEAARMIDNLLDGAKLHSGRIHPHREPLELAAVLAEMRESLAPALRHSGVRMQIDVPDSLPRLFADRDMLGRVVANLVSNAIKFSPPQGVITLCADRHSVATARVSVIDCGDGIAPQDMRRIFRRFEQGSNRVAGGVGLGLSIVRQLVRLHGGRVTAESTPGKGSRFNFTVPLFLPAALLRRHLADAAKQAAAPTVWLFDCPARERYSAIHRLITATVRARDLVLPEADGRRIVLITAARDPQRLVDRIRQQVQMHRVTGTYVQRLTTDELTRMLDGTPVWPAQRTHAQAPPLAG
jgi:signal transduction histidine kinase